MESLKECSLDGFSKALLCQHAVQARPSLVQRLWVRKADDEPLPPQLLRKYIAYARQYVHPVLTGQACGMHATSPCWVES